ncbi:oleate hydratase [Streptomyces sp. bgisy032]|uniref:oleate hydratase n=1 Tax=Streptomyces sp. bgisy032 TaxID=3413773 RepID=UPI003D735C90
MAKAHVVGSGIAALAAAAFLIRDGGFDGTDIHLYEEEPNPGPDAHSTAEAAYGPFGGRMFEAESRCTRDLLSGVPSLDDPCVSVARQVLDGREDVTLDGIARLVDGDGKAVDTLSMGFSERDRLELVLCLATPEGQLDGKRISDCFGEHFFTTRFWFLWCAPFALQPWHSAIDFRRHLRHFLRRSPGLPSTSGVIRTRDDVHDSITRPLTAWLRGHRVTFHSGCRVTDLGLAPGRRGTTVETLYVTRHGRHEKIAVAPGDLVLVTNGSVTDACSTGSHTTAPAPRPHRSDAWLLWHRLARGRDDFGDPAVFDKSVKESALVSFTVTTEDPALLTALEALGAGEGGSVTFTGSPWLLTVAAGPRPGHRDRPDGPVVLRGHGLYTDRAGDATPKPMTMCSGREILEEVLHHLRWDEATTARVLAASTVVPCLMPYLTSPFLARRRGDRPQVVPAGSVNLAFVGRFAEVPDDVAFGVEYSVRTAWTAVARLLHLDGQPPAVFAGRHAAHELAAALETVHRR